jgi:DNA-binding transcriptional MerR regulator
VPQDDDLARTLRPTLRRINTLLRELGTELAELTEALTEGQPEPPKKLSAETRQKIAERMKRVWQDRKGRTPT